jgi:hypothetical protein
MGADIALNKSGAMIIELPLDLADIRMQPLLFAYTSGRVWITCG